MRVQKYEGRTRFEICFIRLPLFLLFPSTFSSFFPLGGKKTKIRERSERERKRETALAGATKKRIRDVIVQSQRKFADTNREERNERTRCEFEARARAPERRVRQACVFYYFVSYFFNLVRTTNENNKTRLFLHTQTNTDLQGLMKKRRELSDKIRQDALLIEELAKTVEDNKKKKKQIERLYEEGVQSQRQICETQKHVVLHLKRESEALQANADDDSY